MKGFVRPVLEWRVLRNLGVCLSVAGASVGMWGVVAVTSVSATSSPSAASAASNPSSGALMVESTPKPTPTTPTAVTENCNGVAPATLPNSREGLTDKEFNASLVSSFLPGGTVHWTVTFPQHRTTRSFVLNDCVVAFIAGNTAGITTVIANENNGEVDPAQGQEPIVKAYSAVLDTGSFTWTDGLDLSGRIDLSWTIPADVAPGTIICDYAKHTGGGSTGGSGDRKAGVCFTVSGITTSGTTTSGTTTSGTTTTGTTTTGTTTTGTTTSGTTTSGTTTSGTTTSGTTTSGTTTSGTTTSGTTTSGTTTSGTTTSGTTTSGTTTSGTTTTAAATTSAGGGISGVTTSNAGNNGSGTLGTGITSPNTGANIQVPLGIGIVLVLAGLSMIALSHRRRGDAG